MEVAERLSREPKISAVCSSDLKRAFDTAEMISKRCGVVEVIKEPGLRERQLGDLQGVLSSEMTKINPDDREDQEIPVYEHCTSAVQRIARKHRGERVVVVTHGATIEALHRRACPDIQSRNASVYVFHVSDDYDHWSIISWVDQLM